MCNSVILRCQITALEYVLQVDYINVEANEIEKNYVCMCICLHNTIIIILTKFPSVQICMQCVFF